MNAVEDGEKGEVCATPISNTAKTIRPGNNEGSERVIGDGGDMGSEDEECGACGEGVSARIAKLESLPSKEEVEAHNASHVPYRSWCPHCVKGKAKAGFHKKQDSSSHTVPTISMDYFYFVKPEEGVERGHLQ